MVRTKLHRLQTFTLVLSAISSPVMGGVWILSFFVFFIFHIGLAATGYGGFAASGGQLLVCWDPPVSRSNHPPQYSGTHLSVGPTVQLRGANPFILRDQWYAQWDERYADNYGNPHLRPVWRHIHFDALGFVIQTSGERHGNLVTLDSRLMLVPLWFVFALSLPLSSLAVVKLYHLRLRCQRSTKGLCPNCGYDLRATPGRCPECGAAAGAGEPGPPTARPSSPTPS